MIDQLFRRRLIESMQGWKDGNLGRWKEERGKNVEGTKRRGIYIDARIMNKEA